MRARLFSSVFALCLMTLVGCGPKPGGDDDGDDSGDDGGGIDASSTDPDGNFDSPDAAICGMQTEPIEVINNGDPPDLLIVNDRSGSMSSPIPTFPPNFTPKWNIMRDALNQVVGATETQIRWGLLEFPTNDDCAVDPGTAVRVPIDISQAAEVSAYLSGRSPNGNTPAQLALQAALTHYNSIPVNAAGRFVLFATDGEPNCSAGDPAAETVAAVTALAAAGIPTYVIGFGGGFTDDAVLNDSALAGGVPKPGGPPHYYAANSASELQMALDQISGGVIIPSCSFTLASAPPDPDNVTVTLNGMVVPRSTAHTNGWDYYPDAMTITFFGSYCDMIQSGSIFEVSFVYGCPGPIID
jgi:hypothetical protein